MGVPNLEVVFPTSNLGWCSNQREESPTADSRLQEGLGNLERLILYVWQAVVQAEIQQVDVDVKIARF